MIELQELKLSDINDILLLHGDFLRRETNLTEDISAKTLLKYFELKQPVLLRASALPTISISELCALMWFGRDYEPNLEDSWEELVKHARSTNPNYILSKRELSNYITDGLRYAGIETEFKNLTNSREEEKRNISSFFSISEFNSELYKYLAKNPNTIHSFSPRRFEELIEDILRSMGYETHLTKQTRDGGRDILAYFSTPLGPTLTIVDCKKYSPENKVGIDLIERFLYIVDRKDDASTGMIITTSSFSSEAKQIEEDRPFRLTLKDFDGLKDMIKYRGTTYSKGTKGLWLPK